MPHWLYRASRYLAILLVTAFVFLLYHTIDITFFNFNLLERVSNNLFKRFATTYFNDELVVMNIGRSDTESIIQLTEIITNQKPVAIGILATHLKRGDQHRIERHFSEMPNVFVCTGESGNIPTARIIEDGNEVHFFHADKPDYLEVRLSKKWNRLLKRRNIEERIFYRESYGVHARFSQAELADTNELLERDSSLFEGRIVLIGYAGDYLPADPEDPFEYFQNSRITPMNPFYGEEYLAPDMHDVMISANIILTLTNDDFLTEVSIGMRVMVILAFALLNVFLVNYIRTKYFILTLLIDAIVFLVLMGIASYVIVILFYEYNLFLTLNELPLILVFCSISTLLLNREPDHRIENREASSS
jgi:hypothetical protein